MLPFGKIPKSHVGIISVSIVSALLFVAVSVSIMINQVEKVAVSMGQSIAREVAGRVSSFLEEKVKLLETLGYHIRGRIDVENVEKLLKEAVPRGLGFWEIGFVNLSGEGILGSGQRVTLGKDRYFIEAVTSGNPTFSDVFMCKECGEKAFRIYVPVKTGRKLTGVMIGTIRTDDLRKVVEGVSFGARGFPTSYVAIVDRNGMTILHPREEFEGQFNILKDERSPKELKELASRAMVRSPTVGEYTFGGIRKVAFVWPIGATDWNLYLISDKKSWRKFIFGGAIKLIFFLALATVVTIVLHHLFSSRRLAGEFAALRSLADAVKRLDESHKPVVIRDKVLEDLSSAITEAIRAIGRQKSALASLTRRVEQSCRDIQGSLKALEETVDGVSKGLEELRARINYAEYAKEAVARRFDKADASLRELKNVEKKINEGMGKLSELPELRDAVTKMVIVANSIAELVKSTESEIGAIAKFVGEVRGQAGELARLIRNIERNIGRLRSIVEELLRDTRSVVSGKQV